MNTVFPHELVTGAGGGGKAVFTALSTGALMLGTGMKAFTKVSEGEMGVRTHFGKATRDSGPKEGELYGIVGPGIRLVFPFTHSIRTISVQDRTNHLPEIQIDCEDQQLKIDSSIIWAVRADGDNPYRALFKVENENALTQTVTSLCVAGLHEVTSNTSREALNNRRQVFGDVRDVVGDELLGYGVALRRVNLQTTTATFGEMVRQAGIAQSAAMLGSLASTHAAA